MTQWRLYLVGAALAGLFGLAMYIAHLQTKAAVAKREAEQARVQAEVSEATVQAIDRVTVRDHIITKEVQNVTREIDALPSGNALVPDDVAAAWGDGIDGLHQHANAVDGQDSGNAEKLPKD